VKKTNITLLALFVVCALAAFQLGCGGADDANASTGESSDAQPAADATEAEDKDGDKDGEDEKKEEAVPVEVAALERGAIESVLRFSTNLEAESQVQVFSQAKRLVTELLVEEGDSVRRGQVLLRLQNQEQHSALDKVTTQLAKAEREHERKERLREQDLISEQEYNDATYELDRLEIELEDAERELGYTEVLAPISGRLTQRLVNLGDQVQIGQHLFDVIDFDSIVARIFVPERHLAELRPGLVARMTSQATGGREYEGRLQRIAPIVDPRTGTVKVTIEVGGQPGLRPGMYVDVDLVTATNGEAVLVPKRAVVYDQDQMFVFRLNDERRVERIFIEPRLADKNFIEPAEGLEPGDRVVIAGQAGLKDGALVKLPGDKDETDDATAESDAAEAVDKASL